MQALIRNLRIVKPTGLLFRTSASMGMMKLPKVGPNWSGAPLGSGIKNWMSHDFHHKNVIKSSYEGPGFYVQQMLTGCLAIYSYYIESGNECFLIDPLFDTAQYNEIIKSRGKKLVGIFSTHYHADYVSGQYDLQKQHKCKIYMGPKAEPGQNLVVLPDKGTVKVGNITLECWHTPGHTQESSCLIVNDKDGRKDTVFTGDTVFMNQVGRPDLAVKTNLTAENLAEMLYDSLQKFKTLNDDIRIYPGHGSGSSCGKSIGKGDFCTVGNQKQSNYALKAASKADFVKQVLQDMPKPPAYFGYNAKLNKFTPFFYEQAAKKVYLELVPEQVFQLSKKDDVIILDVRGTEALKGGIIENSICVGFDGGFATWVGALFDPTDKFVIYGTDEQAKESVTRLFRIGYINILGHCNFSIDTWKAKGFPVITPEMVDEVIQPGCTVLDCRKPGEWKDSGVVEGATLLELNDIYNHPEKLDKSKEYVVHCRSGYRARIAWSFLVDLGYKAKCYPHSFDSIFKSGKAKLVKY